MESRLSLTSKGVGQLEWEGEEHAAKRRYIVLLRWGVGGAYRKAAVQIDGEGTESTYERRERG